jgi:hypothetical protein
VVPDWTYEETNLVATVRRAWRKPLADLTGHEFRTLVSQGFALEWLAIYALEIAEHFPIAYFSNYEGELAYAILRHAEEFWHLAPAKLRSWLNSDLSSVADIVEPPGEESYLEFRELLRDARMRYG